MKYKISFAVIFLIAIGLVAWLTRPPTSDNANPQIPNVASIVSKNKQMASNPKMQSGASPSENVSTKDSLIKSHRSTIFSEQYARTSDLKSILDQAKLHPEKGSYFYAAMALRECEQLPLTLFSALIPAGSEIDPKRDLMVERAKKRCANITEQDLKGLRKLGSDGVAAGDIGFKAVAPITLTFNYFDPAIEAEKRRATVEALYGSPDAGITELAARELMGSADFISINQRQLGEIERSSLPAAILLLSCDLGATCDTTNFLVQLECVGRGRCAFTSVDDYVQRISPENWGQWTRGTRYDYQTAVRLKNEISAAIARGIDQHSWWTRRRSHDFSEFLCACRVWEMSRRMLMQQYPA